MQKFNNVFVEQIFFQLKEELEEAGDDDAAFKTCNFSILKFVPNHFFLQLSLGLLPLALSS